MAKMFYTLEETAAKLGVSEDRVKDMVARGELQEFRDRDRLMFKVEQVDLKSGGAAKGGDDDIPLAESGELESLTLASSGSAPSLAVDPPAANPKEQTGISIFDVDATEDSDPSAVTRVTPSVAGITSPGGSAMMDLTRGDSADTGLGAELLQDAYSPGGSAPGGSAPGGTALGAENAGLFETSGSGSSEPVAAVPMMAAFAEPYDGPGSGLVGGLAFGTIAALAIGLVAVLLALAGASSQLASIGDNLWMFVGVGAAITVVAALVGFVLGRRG
ncbi:MAG: helix-turn-helix domain-containing protein [Planctomycetota bacterium]|nr:helix-turn-helix domain-containing protein [Planctomycetota bacterium]